MMRLERPLSLWLVEVGGGGGGVCNYLDISILMFRMDV